MNRAHWKFKLPGPGEHDIEMPKHSIVMKVAEQGGELFVWAWVFVDEKEKSSTRFRVLATGEEVHHYLDRQMDYLDTVVMKNGLVWHIWCR